jgi:hypothetical protein
VVFTRPVAGKKLIGTAGAHQIVTDRKPADGGTDEGPTSGELLLLAMASCATGSIRGRCEAGRALKENDIRVEVALVPPKQAGARDAILVTAYLPPAVLAASRDQIAAAALAGNVCSRVALGSEVELALKPLADFPHKI